MAPNVPNPVAHNRHVVERTDWFGHDRMPSEDGSALTIAEVEWGAALHRRKLRLGRARLDAADLLAVAFDLDYVRPGVPAAPRDLAVALEEARCRKRSRHRPRIYSAFLLASEVLGILVNVFGYRKRQGYGTVPGSGKS